MVQEKSYFHKVLYDMHKNLEMIASKQQNSLFIWLWYDLGKANRLHTSNHVISNVLSLPFYLDSTKYINGNIEPEELP
jgi:hypothetical protein